MYGFWKRHYIWPTATTERERASCRAAFGELGKPTDENFPAQSIFASLTTTRFCLIPKVDNISHDIPKKVCVPILQAKNGIKLLSRPLNHCLAMEIRGFILA